MAFLGQARTSQFRGQALSIYAPVRPTASEKKGAGGCPRVGSGTLLGAC